MAGTSSIEKLQAPALPVPADSSVRGYLSDLNNILRLFFNRAANNINLVTGNDGGRFIDSPNGFFFDNADQTITTINVAQPVRFNQTYLNNAVTIGAQQYRRRQSFAGLAKSKRHECWVLYEGVHGGGFWGGVSAFLEL